LGVGSGDAQQVLINQYAENGFTTGVEERYNAHNAYFQALVETGLPGMLFFLGFFLGCLWLAWKDKNYLWGAFLLLFMVNITTESMLKTQSGVVFFSFFNALLGLNSSRKRG
jgi:O-antigen ligase